MPDILWTKGREKLKMMLEKNLPAGTYKASTKECLRTMLITDSPIPEARVSGVGPK
jgi:hypothetical protein